MAFNDLEKKRIERALNSFLTKRRPPLHIRPQLDVGYRIDGQSVEVFEIRPQWDQPSIIRQYPKAKATYVKTQQCWKVFWKRADLKWHSYEPAATVATIDDFLNVVDQDAYGCFWG
jgi:hypothetical protein